MGPRRGRLIRSRHPIITISFTLGAPSANGQPSYLDVHDAEPPLEENELITVHSDDGYCFRCRVLDNTTICALVAPVETKGTIRAAQRPPEEAIDEDDEPRG
jgi:hypothetical protein